MYVHEYITTVIKLLSTSAVDKNLLIQTLLYHIN